MSDLILPESASSGDNSNGPSRGLLSFYDRLRHRVAAALERRTGRAGQLPVDLLLLIPDLFVFLARMAADRDVPRDVRAVIGGALAYFLLPIDLLPEALLGVGGFVDDVVLAAYVLDQALDERLEVFAEKHWSGSGELREQLAKVAGAANGLLGEDLARRIEDLAQRRSTRRPPAE